MKKGIKRNRKGFFWGGGDIPAAYGGSQARDLIRSTAAGLHHRHSNAGYESHVCNLNHSPRQRWILNPLNEARE